MRGSFQDVRAAQTILLVEDDSNDVFLMRRAFAKNEIHDDLQVVGDGQQATEYLSGKGRFCDREHFPFPSLIITDLKMPLMDGLQLLKWMRAKHVRVSTVLLSSSVLPRDIDAAYRLGACSYYLKPVSFEKLVPMVNHIYQYWMNKPEELSCAVSCQCTSTWHLPKAL